MSETGNGKGNGAAAPTAAPGGAERSSTRVELADAPEELRDLVASCIDYVRTAIGTEPDLSPETLPLVDHYLLGARESVRERPQVMPLIARAVGAYFGEVARRHLDVFWVIGPDERAWRLCGTRAFFSFNPVGMAYRALVGSDEHPGPGGEVRLADDEREWVELRLAQLPSVDDDEFGMLSTRLEVLEIVQDELRARMKAGGVDDVVFEAEDYAAEDG